MWVDLWSKGGVPRAVEEVLAEVRDRYEEETTLQRSWEFASPPEGFRHAVTFVNQDGVPIRHSPAAERFATELLVEWGQARGGAVRAIHRGDWDFGNRVGYGAEFAGALRAADRDTRLKGEGCGFATLLRDREELFIIPPTTGGG